MKFPVQSQHLGPGRVKFTLESWTQFNGIIQALLELPHYIFRGHRRNDWLLEPTLTRQIKTKPDPSVLRDAHLKTFRYAIRGRRGNNPAPFPSDNDLWAIGQHNGLATPLLDWTTSPYVALFFAFADEAPNDSTPTRVVWMLNETRVTTYSKEFEFDSPDDVIDFIRPLTDENSRLVSQSGLFTMTTGLFDIDSWVTKHQPKEDDRKVTLARVDIPNQDRKECLKALNRMNINYASLFPDLQGASLFSNMRLEIDKY